MSNGLKMKKNNRILYVEQGRAKVLLAQGYDQVDEKGNIVKRATGGRSVSLPEYNKALERIKELENNPADKELEEAKKEIKALKSENTKLKKSLDEKKSE
ncbi:hypothetical protein [Sutcliffiella halmapala]|uniref:hypothetical protein n=1 Tax=Sutcliffiella halmapala TaxID=79882 RepID=UPI000994A35A|nr:hypothetical protein [Sutcliffiella halmapala]